MVVKVKAAPASGVRPYEIAWSTAADRVVDKKGDPQGGTDFARIVHDLHTGKIFSARFGFLWADTGTLAILALAATGVVLYVLPWLKRRANRRKIDGTAATRPAGLAAGPSQRTALTTPDGKAH
jgi:hypothetical protein